MKGYRPPSPDPIRPKPSANAFYEGSRYYFEPPPEPQAPQCTCKVMCSAKTPNVASWKCYTCATFDPRSKGWFCNACFEKHHPWYREKHHFVTIAEDDDMEYDAVVQNYRAEQDRTIDGVKGLIEMTKENLKICKVIEEDYRPDDMLKEVRKEGGGFTLILACLRELEFLNSPGIVAPKSKPIHAGGKNRLKISVKFKQFLQIPDNLWLRRFGRHVSKLSQEAKIT